MKEPKLYQYDFDGAFMPRPGDKPAYENEGFSVGIFQWIPTRDGKKLKRGKVSRRIRGKVAQAEVVFDAAKKICAELNTRWPKE